MIGRFGQDPAESGNAAGGIVAGGSTLDAILTSLRKVIESEPASGDGGAAPAPPGAPPPDAHDEDVLELTRPVASAPPQPAAFPSLPFPPTGVAVPQAGPAAPAVFPAKTPSLLRGGAREGDDARPPTPAPPAASVPVSPAAPEEPPAVSAAKPTPLLSDTAASAAVDAFGALNRRPAPLGGPPDARPAGRTVDDLVLDVVRPEVKAWLDKHLPALVERLVQAEIARLARRSDAG